MKWKFCLGYTEVDVDCEVYVPLKEPIEGRFYYQATTRFQSVFYKYAKPVFRVSDEWDGDLRNNPELESGPGEMDEMLVFLY